jgi:hypothetical protein
MPAIFSLLLNELVSGNGEYGKAAACPAEGHIALSSGLGRWESAAASLWWEQKVSHFSYVLDVAVGSDEDENSGSKRMGNVRGMVCSTCT